MQRLSHTGRGKHVHLHLMQSKSCLWFAWRSTKVRRLARDAMRGRTAQHEKRRHSLNSATGPDFQRSATSHIRIPTRLNRRRNLHVASARPRGRARQTCARSYNRKCGRREVSADPVSRGNHSQCFRVDSAHLLWKRRGAVLPKHEWTSVELCRRRTE